MTTRAERMLALVAEAGLTVHPYGQAGALLLSGRGVYILVDRIESVLPTDLEPVDQAKGKHHGDQ